MFNQDDLTLPDEFSNVVRLFPLPNLVLFPGVVQALHIFEPRYRQLMEDSLTHDQLITMAFLIPDPKSGQPSPAGPPEIASTVCIGKILSHSKLDDGRYNLFLVGTRRAHVLRELEVDTPYRMAKVSLLEDRDDGDVDSLMVRHQIVEEFRRLASLQKDWNHEALDQFLNDDLPIGQLLDMIGYACGADPAEQQLVLETEEIGRRAKLILQILRRRIQVKIAESQRPTFPPDFSLN